MFKGETSVGIILARAGGTALVIFSAAVAFAIAASSF
jgi:hypothetical protein